MGCGVTLGYLVLLISLVYSNGKSLNRQQDIAYVADPAGNVLSKPQIVPQRVGSPVSLARPDRYEFYTFDETGELIKRLMTLEEIQEIIATGEGDDGHLLTIAQTDLTKPSPSISVQPPSHVKVHTIVNNVQNVLKAEMEAQKTNPSKPGVLDTPDVSNSWSMILPAIFGNTGGSITPDTLISSHIEPETDVISESLNLEKQDDENELPSKDIIDEELLDDLVEGSTISDLEDESKTKAAFAEKTAADIVVTERQPPTTNYIVVETKPSKKNATSPSVQTTTPQITKTTIKYVSSTTAQPISKISSTVVTTTSKPIPSTSRTTVIASSTENPVKLSTTVKNKVTTVQSSTTTEKASTTIRVPENKPKVTTSPPRITTEKTQTKVSNQKETTTRRPITTTQSVIKNDFDENKRNQTTSSQFKIPTTTMVPDKESTPVQVEKLVEKKPEFELNIGEIINQIAGDLRDPTSTPKYFDEKASLIVNETTIKLAEKPIVLNQEKVTPSPVIISNTFELLKSTAAALIDKSTERIVESSTLVNTYKPTTESATNETPTFIKILPIVKVSEKPIEKINDKPVSIEKPQDKLKDAEYDDSDEKSDEIDDYLELVTEDPFDDYTGVTRPSLDELSDSITDLISQIVDVSRPPAIPIANLNNQSAEKITTPEIRSTTTSPPTQQSSTESSSTTKVQASTTEKLISTSTLKAEPSTTVKRQTVAEPKEELTTVVNIVSTTTSNPGIKVEQTSQSAPIIQKTTPKYQEKTTTVVSEKTTTAASEISAKPTNKTPEKITPNDDVTPTTYRPPLSLKTTKLPTTIAAEVKTTKSTTTEAPKTTTTQKATTTTTQKATTTTTQKTTTTTEPIKPLYTKAPVKDVEEIKPIKIQQSTTTKETIESNDEITTNPGITEDAELMEMLSQVSQIFKISPKLESKSDDLQEEGDEEHEGEILLNPKITYKKNDAIVDDSDKVNSDISIKDEETVLEQLLPKINTLPEKNITIVETEQEHVKIENPTTENLEIVKASTTSTVDKIEDVANNSEKIIENVKASLISIPVEKNNDDLAVSINNRNQFEEKPSDSKLEESVFDENKPTTVKLDGEYVTTTIRANDELDQVTESSSEKTDDFIEINTKASTKIVEATTKFVIQPTETSTSNQAPESDIKSTTIVPIEISSTVEYELLVETKNKPNVSEVVVKKEEKPLPERVSEKLNNPPPTTEKVEIKETPSYSSSTEKLSTTTEKQILTTTEKKQQVTTEKQYPSTTQKPYTAKIEKVEPTTTEKYIKLQIKQNIEQAPERIQIKIETLENKGQNTLESAPQTKENDAPSRIDIDEKNQRNDTDDTWKLVSTIVSKNNSKTHVSINTPIHPAHKIQYSTPDLSDHYLKDADSNEPQGLEVTTKNLGADVFEFSQLCNELAFRYWDAVATSAPDPKRSLVTSPFSVIALLSMMFLGARGATSGEMNDILKLDDMVTFNPHIVFKNVTESIEVSKKAGVATSAFVRELFSDRSKGRLISFYKDRVQQFYGGHVEEINFGTIGDIVRRRTNLLVKRQTWGKIPEYIKGNNMVMRPPLSVFAANIFQTDCTSASTEGRDGEMYFAVSPNIRQRRLVPVPAVLYKSGFLAGYVTELDATVAAIGGADQIVSTILLMPGQQGSTAQGDHILNLQDRITKSAFTDATWTKLLRSLKTRPSLELQIPRFSHRSIENGSLSLQKIGLKDLFSVDKADLRGLNGIANDLYLSDMMLVNTFSTCGEGLIGEQHHVEVYPGEPNKAQRRLWRTQRPVLQEPLDAPMLSDLWEEPRDYQRAFHDPLHDNSYLSMPLHLRPRQARLPENTEELPRLKFDRPFMFFVRHNPTGLILYMGRYNPRLLP